MVTDFKGEISMTDDQMKIVAAGAYLYGAIFVVTLIVVGLMKSNGIVFLSGLTASGTAYLSQNFMAIELQGDRKPVISFGFMLISIAVSVIGYVAIVLRGI